jgi:DNA-binding NarL/FixJ family response regulator
MRGPADSPKVKNMHRNPPRQDQKANRSPVCSGRKKILIVDDHSVVRRGLVTLINEHPDLEVCGDAENESEAVGMFRSREPDLLLADWSLKQNDSSGLIATLLREKPGLPVLVLSIHDEMTHAPAALEAGARGYIMKREAAEKIIEGIQSVLAGDFYLAPRALEEIAATPASRLLKGSRFSVSGREATSPPPMARQEPYAAWAVSVVIPVYNSRSTIAKLCEQLVGELREVGRLEVVLVDDGSEDDSAEVCRQMSKKYPRVVRAVELTRNFGEHNAVLAGLNESTGDYCVIMDDDLQNPPSEVKKLLREAARGYDVVYSRYPERRHPFYRRLGSLFQNLTARLLIGKPSGLYLSSFKVLSAGIVQSVCEYKGPKPYLDALILRATTRIGTVECLHRTRAAGESSYTWAKLIGLWCRLALGFSIWPVRLLVAAGLLVCSAGLGVGLAGQTTQEWVGTQWMPWLSRGLLFLAVAVVGEYLGWLILLARKSPQYVVRRPVAAVEGSSPRVSTGPLQAP